MLPYKQPVRSLVSDTSYVTFYKDTIRALLAQVMHNLEKFQDCVFLLFTCYVLGNNGQPAYLQLNLAVLLCTLAPGSCCTSFGCSFGIWTTSHL